MLPPVALISFAVKSVDDSDRVIVNVAVWPTFNEGTSETMLIVGSTVSTERATMLETSLLFPAASLNFGEETFISAVPVKLSSGVNVAV